MKKLLFILLLLPVSLFGQYLQKDTTYIFTYEQSKQLAKDRETRKRLEKEIEILVKIGVEKNIIIEKLSTRDSLYSLEIKKCDQLNSILFDKVDRYSDIIDNYNILLLNTEQKLATEIKKTKREQLWKNIYKYGTSVLGASLLILYITK